MPCLARRTRCGSVTPERSRTRRSGDGGGPGKRVVKISREKHPYRTELTPVSFLRRSAYVFPDKIAVVHGDSPLQLSGARGTGQPSGLRPARARPPAPGSRGHHRPQHAGHAGGALRRARGRPRARAHQRPARAATRSGTSCSTPGPRSCWSTRSSRRVVKPLDLTALRVIRIDDTGVGGRSLRGLPGSGLARARRRRGWRTSTRRSPSTTRRGPPGAPRA